MLNLNSKKVAHQSRASARQRKRIFTFSPPPKPLFISPTYQELFPFTCTVYISPYLEYKLIRLLLLFLFINSMLLIYSNGVHNHFLKLIGNCCFWWEAPIKFTDCTFVHLRHASYQIKSNILSHGIICLSLLGLKIDLYCFYRWIGLASPCPSSLTYAVFQRNAF